MLSLTDLVCVCLCEYVAHWSAEAFKTIGLNVKNVAQKGGSPNKSNQHFALALLIRRSPSSLKSALCCTSKSGSCLSV